MSNEYQLTKTETVFPIPETVPDNPTFRQLILELEAYIARQEHSFKKNGLPLDHSFADGIYMRTIYIPKGAFCIGAFHKASYISVVLKGDMSVVTEGGIKRVVGPMTAQAPAGTKRFGYAHKDTVWMTIHPNPDNLTDIRELEGIIHQDDYEEYPHHSEIEPSPSVIEAYHTLLNAIYEKEFTFSEDAFRTLTLEVFAKEKQGFWSDWSEEERAAMLAGDWRAFSRSRGYTEEEIEKVQQWTDMIEAAVTVGKNPFNCIQDISARTYLRNLKADERGEIALSSFIPSNQLEEK